MKTLSLTVVFSKDLERMFVQIIMYKDSFNL